MADSTPTPTAPVGRLRTKLVRNVVLILLSMGVLLVGSLAKLQVDRSAADEQRLEQLIRDGLSAKARQLTDAHAQALGILAADNAFSDMQRLVQNSVAEDPDVIYGAFIDQTGLALAFSSPDHPTGADAEVARTSLGVTRDELSLQAPQRHTVNRFDHPVLEFRVPVQAAGEYVGVLLYGVSAKRVAQALQQSRALHAEELRSALLQLSLIILVVTLIAVHLASRAANNLTRPIVSLTQAARQLSAGKRNVRVDVNSGDEVQVLGDSFNKMVGDLDRSYAELRQSNQKLRTEIEERQRAEAERSAAQRSLMQAQKMDAIGQLAGGVAHDFNNLLVAVQGNTEFIKYFNRSEQTKAYTQAIEQAVTQGANLTRQLLTFSRNQGDEPRVVAPGEVIWSVQKLVGRVLEAQLSLEVDVCDDTPNVYIDPGRLEQVVMNLVVNARDALHASGTISVTSRARHLESPCSTASGVAPVGSYLELVVGDDGDGMSEDTVARIFEPFFTTKTAGKGTGLGLATVHGIVRQARGYIDVQSELGQGTCFTILIPARESSSEPVGAQRSMVVPRGAGQEILVCEDENVVRHVVEQQLAMHGYNVRAFGRPNELLEALANCDNPPSLLVTDVIMPDLTGPELAAAVRTWFPQLPVLFISGYTAGVLEEQGIAGVGDALLKKPFTSQDLLVRAAKLIAGSDTQQPIAEPQSETA